MGDLKDMQGFDPGMGDNNVIMNQSIDQGKPEDKKDDKKESLLGNKKPVSQNMLGDLDEDDDKGPRERSGTFTGA